MKYRHFFFFFFFCNSCFGIASTPVSKEHYTKKLLQAYSHFDDKEYAEAILYLQQLLEALEQNPFFPFDSAQMHNELLLSLQQKLAYAFIQIGEWEQAQHLLSKRKHLPLKKTLYLEKSWYEGCFLSGLALFHLKRYTEALASFEEVFSCPVAIDHIIDCHFFAGICALKCLQPKTARIHFENIATKPMSLEKRKQLVELLVETEITEGDYDKAFQMITQHEKENIGIDVHLLRGKLLYAMESYEEAIAAFEQTVSSSKEYYLMLGRAYLEMAKNPSEQKSLFLERSQVYLEAALPHEEVIFCLACNFWMRYQETDDALYKDKAISLLSGSLPTSSRFRAKLARIFLEHSFQKRREQFLALLKEQLNAEQKLTALCLKSLDELNHAEDVSATMEAIKTAHSVPTTDEHIFLSLCVAQKLLTIDRPKAALELLEQDVHHELQEEQLFLQAFAQNATKPTENQTLHLFCSLFPHSPLIVHAMHLIANSYLAGNDVQKAFDLFQTIAWQAADYPHIDAVFFSAAECAEFLAQEQLARKFRKELFTSFPTSEYAPISFFKYFPEEEYFSFNKGAINHLKKLPPAMSNSCFAIPAFFYIGASLKEDAKVSEHAEQTLKEALTSLQQTATVYTNCLQEKTITQELLPTFTAIYFQSKILQARILLQLAVIGTQYYKQAEQTLHQLKVELVNYLYKNPPSAYTDMLHEMVQEAGFRRAKTLIALNQNENAQLQLEEVIELQHKLHLSPKEFLARTYTALGSLFAEQGSFTQADTCLTKAEAIQAKGLNRELLLEIWIARSHVYKQQRQFAKAMTQLSRVINDDCVSSLRIQAMFLRAELYELQHRKDLAIKQLEATAKKGGEWGTLAAKKLGETYGFQ